MNENESLSQPENSGFLAKAWKRLARQNNATFQGETVPSAKTQAAQPAREVKNVSGMIVPEGYQEPQKDRPDALSSGEGMPESETEKHLVEYLSQLEPRLVPELIDLKLQFTDETQLPAQPSIANLVTEKIYPEDKRDVEAVLAKPEFRIPAETESEIKDFIAKNLITIWKDLADRLIKFPDPVNLARRISQMVDLSYSDYMSVPGEKSPVVAAAYDSFRSKSGGEWFPPEDQRIEASDLDYRFVPESLVTTIYKGRPAFRLTAATTVTYPDNAGVFGDGLLPIKINMSVMLMPTDDGQIAIEYPDLESSENGFQIDWDEQIEAHSGGRLSRGALHISPQLPAYSTENHREGIKDSSRMSVQGADSDYRHVVMTDRHAENLELYTEKRAKEYGDPTIATDYILKQITQPNQDGNPHLLS